MSQKILYMTTDGPSLRSNAESWGAEDPDRFIKGKAIGFTPGPDFFYNYKTPLEALSNGWKLLCDVKEVHQRHQDCSQNDSEDLRRGVRVFKEWTDWEWIFVKD